MIRCRDVSGDGGQSWSAVDVQDLLNNVKVWTTPRELNIFQFGG